MVAREKEPLIIDAGGKGELKIIKAIFGKFERGFNDVPSNYPIYNVTEKITSRVALGELEIPIDDSMVDGIFDKATMRALRIVYSTNGAVRERTVPVGRTLNLTQNTPEPKLINKDGEVYWVTPYAGKMTCTTFFG